MILVLSLTCASLLNVNVPPAMHFVADDGSRLVAEIPPPPPPPPEYQQPSGDDARQQLEGINLRLSARHPSTRISS